jgi:hypothetical protein
MPYIRFTLGRSEMYEQETVYLAAGMPLGQHYILSVMAWLLMMSSVMFYPALSACQGAWRVRLRSAGCASAHWALGASVTPFVCLLLLAAIQAACFGRFTVVAVFACAMFVCAFATLVCALCRSETMAAMVCFALSAAAAFLSGGVIPPTLMPKALRELADQMPVALIRRALNGEGYAVLLGLGALGMLLSILLLAFGFEREEKR